MNHNILREEKLQMRNEKEKLRAAEFGEEPSIYRAYCWNYTEAHGTVWTVVGSGRSVETLAEANNEILHPYGDMFGGYVYASDWDEAIRVRCKLLQMADDSDCKWSDD